MLSLRFCPDDIATYHFASLLMPNWARLQIFSPRASDKWTTIKTVLEPRVYSFLNFFDNMRLSNLI